MEKKHVKIKVDGGTYIFKLERLLADKGLTKSKLINDTGTDFKVIKRLATGEIVRIDIYVLARLCNYLNCNVSDIVEFKRGS